MEEGANTKTGKDMQVKKWEGSLNKDWDQELELTAGCMYSFSMTYEQSILTG